MTPEQAYEILKNKTYKDETEKQNCLEYIKKHPYYAYNYAKYVIKGRFPEAEEYIKKDPKWAYYYARDVIKGRFHEAEEYIKTDPRYAYSYAENVIKGRWIEAEEYIKKDPEYAYYYVRDVIKDRWIEAEEIIKKDPCWASYYAKNVIKDRWIEAEPYIKKDPFYAYAYAKDVIKGRWIEFEKLLKIKKMKGFSRIVFDYCVHIVERPIPELENYLTDNQYIKYCAIFDVQSSRQEQENKLLLQASLNNDHKAKRFFRKKELLEKSLEKLKNHSKEEIISLIYKKNLESKFFD